MNCNDVDRALSEESRLPPSPRARQSCNAVRISALGRCDPPSPATLRQIAEGIAANLRPVRPMAPTRYFFGAFVGIFVSIVALGVYRMGAFAIAVMTPLQTAAILSALAISTGLLAYSLVHQAT